MSDLQPLTGEPAGRSGRLDRVLSDLLAQAPEIEAAAVVSFDGLPMVSALPPSMDEDRVAAMSAALLSLGERAAVGLGRGELSQVYIEGESGTVFLVSCDNEAVLVAVAAAGAKAGLMLYEVRRSANQVANVLREDDAVVGPAAPEVAPDAPSATAPTAPAPTAPSAPATPLAPVAPSEPPAAAAAVAELPAYAPVGRGPAEENGYAANGWTSYAPGAGTLPGEPTPWS